MTGHRALSALSSLRWEEWEIPRPRSEGKASEAEGTAPTEAHSTRGLLSEGTALSQATGMDFVPIWPLQWEKKSQGLLDSGEPELLTMAAMRGEGAGSA